MGNLKLKSYKIMKVGIHYFNLILSVITLTPLENAILLVFRKRVFEQISCLHNNKNIALK